MAWGDAMPQDGSRSGYKLLLCVGAGESGRDPITEVFMATDDQVTPPPWRASEKVWKSVGLIATGMAGPACTYGFARCVLELRDRVEALEAMAKTAALLVHEAGPTLALSEDAFQALDAPPVPAPAGGWSGVAVDCLPPISPAVWVGTPADVAPQVVPTTSTVLTVDELADCLPANAWAGPEGYSRQAFARHLLGHPRIGPLLRGEGAGVSKRVVLPEEPLYPPLVSGGAYYMDGFDDAWAAARTEVERQQGGQVNG
jgi:hypothetical protein